MQALRMLPILLSIASFAVTVLAASVTRHHNAPVWNVKNFQNLVTFGDSYTDESRLSYFVNHGGSPPPPGLLLPEGLATASGGRTWPRFVVQYTGNTVNGQWDPQLELYDYAVSGAVCSNEITPRAFAQAEGGLFPSVLEYEIPAFKADKNTTRYNTTQPFFTASLTPLNSVYSLWIGTNDLGVDAFLTDSQVRGKVITDYTNCVFQVLDELYATGSRVFVLMNTAPLQLAPLYANETLHGTTAANATYWPTKPSNLTQIAEIMHEYTTTVNNVYKYQTPFEQYVQRRYPGASWALFDVWSLMSTIYNNPSDYFNGTEPPEVQFPEHECNGDGSVCTYRYNRTSSDSFMWYDALHPSVQTDRIIARSFVDVLNGTSQYATYY